MSCDPGKKKSVLYISGIVRAGRIKHSFVQSTVARKMAETHGGTKDADNIISIPAVFHQSMADWVGCQNIMILELLTKASPPRLYIRETKG